MKTYITVASTLLSVYLLLISTVSYGQSTQAVQTLINQGLTAQAEADWPRAKNAWEKVLLSDRNQPDALRGLFYEALQRGEKDAAAEFLNKLSQNDESHEYILPMRRDLEKVRDGVSTLTEARRQIRNENLAEGIDLYRISFGRVNPEGSLALEFYTTIGGMDNGWEEAAQGLERLAAGNPEEWTYQLAYAKHLTYRPSERAQGIQLLIDLAQQSISRSSALPALRESIRWLPNSHSNIPLFEQYVALVDDDEEISNQLAALRSSRTPAQEQQLQRGFTALRDNSLERAADGFKRVLRSRPQDPDALAGLGLVELRNGNFEESAALLDSALEAAGTNRADWRRALNSARYWSIIEKARALVSEETETAYEAARVQLMDAIEINPDDDTGITLLAETLHRLERLEEAETYYLRAISINSTNAVALRGLGELYNQTSRFDEAQALARQLTETPEGDSDTVADGILAQSLIARARAYMKQNEFDLAQVELEKAHKAQSYNPWVTLELAQLLIRRQRPDRARLLMNGIEQQDPLNSSALHALAEFAYLENRHRDALAFLERVPVEERTPQMTNTQNRVWMRLQVERSVQFAQNNDFGRARRTLGEAENFAGSQPDMASALAAGWIELGEEERALSIMRTALKLDSDVWLQLQYAGLLLKIQRNKELSQLIQALQARTDLDEFQLRELSHIEVSLALRLSDQYLKSRQFARAYEVLDPFIGLEDEYPNIRMMVGRLYQETGDLDQAMSSYSLILRDHPNHLDARRSAVGLLIDSRDYVAAQGLVDEGLELYAEHPRMVLLAGQLEIARGRPREALDYFRNALLLVSADTDNSRFTQTNFRIPSEDDLLEVSGDNAALLDFLDTSEMLELESTLGLREEILLAIGKVNAKTSNFIQIGGELRNRSGEAGLDKLTMFRLPLEFNVSAGNSGRLSLSMVAESINADDIQLSDQNTATKFGALALDTSLPRDEVLSVSESGLAFGADYASRFFSMDIGSTPSDYAVSNVVGGLSVSNGSERFRVTGSLSRRALQDSMLSYAGQMDPFLGVSWGGVVKTGGNLRFMVNRKKQGFYGSVGGYSLEGENVASNSMTQFGAGIFWKVKDTQMSELRLGLDIDSLSYDQNLSGYTFGHGGYFSPQNYVNIGVPIQWLGDTGPMQYQVTGKIGFERFEQDDSDYFPNNADLQLQLEELALTAAEPIETSLRGSSNTGVSISLNGQINYQLSSKLSLGSTISLQRSGDYNESRFGLFARYYFAPQEVRSKAQSSGSGFQLP